MFLICEHSSNISWTEAWSLSYQERHLIADQLKKIRDAQREAAGGAKIIRASDLK